MKGGVIGEPWFPIQEVLYNIFVLDYWKSSWNICLRVLLGAERSEASSYLKGGFTPEDPRRLRRWGS